jgi:ABC-type Fe3+ transport system substrate-binding protein
MRKNSLALYLTIFFIAATFLPTFILPVAASPDEVVVLTPHWSGIQDVAKEDFEAWYQDKTGNEVVLTFEYKDTTTSLALIREAGGDPAKVKWDVWWGGGLDAFKLAKADDLLAPFYLPGDTEWEDINSAVPDSFAGLPLKDTDDYTYWGAALSGFGIVYNAKYLEDNNLPAPNDWTDLTDPDYMGHVIMCPPSKSGSNLMIIQIILQYYGWEDGWALVTEMGANIGEYAERSHHVAPYIGRGEYGIAPVIDFYGFGQAAVYPEDVVFFYPPADSEEKSTVINPDSVAVVKGKGDTNPAATEFMKWCLGVDGQNVLFKDPINRLSVRPDAYTDAPPGYFNPFETELTLFVYDDDLGTLRFDIVEDLYDMLLVAPMDDLTDAWTKYNDAKEYIATKKDAGVPGIVDPPLDLQESDAKLAEAYAAFVSLPISGAEVETVSPTYQDSKEEYKAEWLDLAVQKYSDVVELSLEAKAVCDAEVASIRRSYLEAQVQDLETQVEDLESQVSSLSASVSSWQTYTAVTLIIGLIIGALVGRMFFKK